jgi:3-phenylpropionate/trans-cinnamate dioxygenase ferredoxin reductase component
MSKAPTSLIVGGGLAGVTAAETLRAEGFAGHIIVVTDDPADPYDRPPLTKGYLRGESTFDDIALHPRSFYDEHRIELVLGRKVVGLDAHASEMTFEDGGRIHFDAALLATGAEPRALRVPGAELDGVHLLRSVRDADALAAAAAHASNVVVIGAGWIGCETAASLRQLGKDVTIVAPERVPLERVLGERIGGVFGRLHADHGVRLELGRGVTSIEGKTRAEAVVLDDGSRIACDLVVVGVGVVPRQELAESAGIACDNGILVDTWMRTNGSNVYAAGDVANAAHARYGRLRIEHWANARDQGADAARSMLGDQDAPDRIPYFFSDQYDLGLEYTGHALPSDEIVIRGDLEARVFIAFWTRRGVVTAGLNVNVWDVTEDIERLIRSNAAVDLRVLKDVDVPLSALLGEERVA